MRKIVSVAIAASAFIAVPAVAAPTIVVVNALANSTSGGTPLVTGLTFAAGQQFKITSSTNDLWSAGALPRYSDANGIVNRTATAADDSGQPVGSQIGGNFGSYTQGNLTANFGSLVAVTGVNTFQLLGANGVFTSTGGPLNLGYFDSNNGDNFGSITFSISAVPEPATWAMMILGMGAVGGAMRVRRRSVALASA